MLAAIFSCRSGGGGFEEHEFLGLECDDLNNFRCKIFEEISALKANLEVITKKVDNLAQTIEEFQAYNYGFNVKIILGVPER